MVAFTPNWTIARGKMYENTVQKLIEKKTLIKEMVPRTNVVAKVSFSSSGFVGVVRSFACNLASMMISKSLAGLSAFVRLHFFHLLVVFL